MPVYSHKNSPKKYTQHQHAVLLMLKKRLKASYRDVIDYIAEMPDVQAVIGLQAIQHYTTLQKFFTRIKELSLLALIDVYNCKAIAIDSTGFPAYSSSYYEIVRKSRKKRYQKMIIAVDCDKQLILNAISAIGYKHDSKLFILLIENLKARYFIADKGFDSTENIRYAMSKGKALIEIKDNVKSGIRAKLKKINKRHKLYHKRSLAETVIFVIKRKFGDTAYSRTYSLLRKEVLLNALCYNIYREIG